MKKWHKHQFENVHLFARQMLLRHASLIFSIKSFCKTLKILQDSSKTILWHIRWKLHLVIHVWKRKIGNWENIAATHQHIRLSKQCHIMSKGVEKRVCNVLFFWLLSTQQWEIVIFLLNLMLNSKLFHSKCDIQWNNNNSDYKKQLFSFKLLFKRWKSIMKSWGVFSLSLSYSLLWKLLKSHGLSICLTDWLTDWLTYWLTDLLTNLGPVSRKLPGNISGSQSHF